MRLSSYRPMSTFHLPAVCAVLVTLILDQVVGLLEHQVDPADRVVVGAHDEIAFRRWQIRQTQAEPQRGLSRRSQSRAKFGGRRAATARDR